MSEPGGGGLPRRGRLRWALVAVALVVVAVGAYALFARPGRRPDTAAEEIPPVTAPPVIVAEAVVLPVRYAELSMSVGGVVAERLAAAGEEVTSGQVLLRLQAEDQLTALAEAEVGLLRARAERDRLLAQPYPEDLAAARAALARAEAEELAGRSRGGAFAAAAEADVELAQSRLQATERGPRPADLVVAESDVQLAEVRVRRARAQLAKTELRAPFSGQLATVTPQLGERVAPGEAIAQIGDLSAWRVETVDLSELDVLSVVPGADVEISIDAIPDLELAGSVVRVQSFGESRFGEVTYAIEIEPRGVVGQLRWNMTAAVRIDTGARGSMPDADNVGDGVAAEER